MRRRLWPQRGLDIRVGHPAAIGGGGKRQARFSSLDAPFAWINHTNRTQPIRNMVLAAFSRALPLHRPIQIGGPFAPRFLRRTACATILKRALAKWGQPQTVALLIQVCATLARSAHRHARLLLEAPGSAQLPAQRDYAQLGFRRSG